MPRTENQEIIRISVFTYCMLSAQGTKFIAVIAVNSLLSLYQNEKKSRHCSIFLSVESHDCDPRRRIGLCDSFSFFSLEGNYGLFDGNINLRSCFCNINSKNVMIS